MALIPRWQYMTDSSKAMVKRSAITVAIVLIGLTLSVPFLRDPARPGLLRWMVSAESEVRCKTIQHKPDEGCTCGQ